MKRPEDNKEESKKDGAAMHEAEQTARKRYRRAVLFSRVAMVAAVIVSAASLCTFVLGGFKCVFLTLTGIPCPGCGMTRALICLLSLDISGVFHYHPLFFVPPLIVICAVLTLISKSDERKGRMLRLLILMLAAFGVCWLVRLACGWRG